MKVLALTLLLSNIAYPQADAILLHDKVQKRFDFVYSTINNELPAGLSAQELNQLLKQNILENPKHAPSYQILASRLWDSGDFKESKKIIAQGLKANPGNQGLYLSYLSNILEKDNFKSVEKGVEKIVSLGPIIEFRDMIILSSLYERLGDKEQERLSLKSAVSMAKADWQKRLSLLKMAKYYSNLKMHQECVDTYDNILRIDRKNEEAHIYVIECLSQLERYDQSVERSRQGLALIPSDKSMRIAASKALAVRANFHFQNKDYASANKDYVESLLYEKSSDAYKGMAQVAAIDKNDFDKVAKLLEDGLKFYKFEPVYYMYDTLEIFAKSTSHYIEYSQKIIELTSDESQKLWAYYRMGLKLHTEKKRDKLYGVMEIATKKGESFLKKSPENKALAYSLGALYGLYGSDANNLKLLNRGNELLVSVKNKMPESEVGPHIDHITESIKLINSGKVSASELELNIKK